MPNDDYIKRSEVVEELCGQCRFYDSSNDCGLKICSAYPRKERINAIPAADVEPVKNGRWIDENPASPMDPRMRCSVCGHVDLPLAKWRFCPMCGAKMDKEEDSGESI